MVSLSTRLSWSVPLPVPVFAVTVYWVVLIGVTPVRLGPPTVADSAKSPTSTFFTSSSKVTVKSTLVALVGFASALAMVATVGGVPMAPPKSVPLFGVPIGLPARS